MISILSLTWGQTTDTTKPPYVSVTTTPATSTTTGKSLSEALIFAEHGENMLCTEIDFDIQNNLCTQHTSPIADLLWV